jgi:hypothetical protein
VPPHVSQFLERSRPACGRPVESLTGAAPVPLQSGQGFIGVSRFTFPPRRTTSGCALHHQRPALAKRCVLAKGEGRDARAIFVSALTEEVERLAIARGPVQRGDSVVHLSRHHPAIHPYLRIQPLPHEKDFASTRQVYDGWSDDYPGGYLTRQRPRYCPSPGLSAKVSGLSQARRPCGSRWRLSGAGHLFKPVVVETLDAELDNAPGIRGPVPPRGESFRPVALAWRWTLREGSALRRSRTR